MARELLMVMAIALALVLAPLTATAGLAVEHDAGSAATTAIPGHSTTPARTAAVSTTNVDASATRPHAGADTPGAQLPDPQLPGTVGDLAPGLARADLRSSPAVDEASPAVVEDASPADAPGDEPVLLVHGFADTGYTPWWVEMTADLGDAGYEHGEVFVLNLGAIPGSTVDSPEDYGEAVCDAIETVKDETGASEVDVVAHSMGGLDARHCIEKQGGAENVDDLVTLGTPHQGTYVAYLAYITPGARDMVPGSDFLADLNDGQLAPSVEYTAVWSDWDELINPDEYAKLPAEERDSVPNAQNVFVDNTFHIQLVWDDDVFDAWIDRLD